VSLSVTGPSGAWRAPAAAPARPEPTSDRRAPGLVLVLLFLTGLTSMALEVVWIRQFTPYLGTLVYAFAAILTVYLVATLVGSGLYRRSLASPAPPGGARGFVIGWTALGLLALLPLAMADPRLPLPGAARLVIGIAPFCAAVGFLTPMLVDRWSRGDPDRAGRGYAINVVGSILGPLAAGFWLLPRLGERGAGVALALPLFAVGLALVLRPGRLADTTDIGRRRAATPFAGAAAAAVVLVASTAGFETLYPAGQVRRDHTATVIAAGTGLHKRLLVNGQGITVLKPVTKMMAHLPLAALDRPPRDALVVALGMGTTFRSLLSWGIPATAVELVPSVPPLFGFFHPDAPALVASPRARIVVDDGRRFLERSTEQFDVITVDPPPPVEAAGSSLLYSREFYAVAKKRLRGDGILQQWLPGGELDVVASVTRALTDSFPHVRVFHSLEGWGGHFLASRRPIDIPSASVLAARMPAGAVADMLEWGPGKTAEEQWRLMLEREVPAASLIAFAPTAPSMSDNRPYNEYFFLRYYLGNSR
jgi:predicted membrane-bound spermidine synthase